MCTILGAFNSRKITEGAVSGARATIFFAQSGNDNVLIDLSVTSCHGDVFCIINGTAGEHTGIYAQYLNYSQYNFFGKD